MEANKNSESVSTSAASYGLRIGTVLAVVLSWDTNHSVLWSILHGLLGWFYCIYWVFMHRL